MTTEMMAQAIEVDQELFHQQFGREPLAVRHSLAEHPLLDLEAIADLADELPPDSVERHDAIQPLVVPGGAPDISGRPSDTVRTLETNGSWMVLWYIEQSPPYRALLDEILDPVARSMPGREGRMCQREAFLFLSAPGAVTPVHFDPEHNFLLQIRGIKHMNTCRFPDRKSALYELNRYFDGGHRNLTAVPSESTEFVMHPGDGVYVPSFYPHWVQNGPAASISLSITFRSERSRRNERVHKMNARLRRLRLSPRPPGVSEKSDRAKAAVAGGYIELRRMATRRNDHTRSL